MHDWYLDDKPSPYSTDPLMIPYCRDWACPCFRNFVPALYESTVSGNQRGYCQRISLAAMTHLVERARTAVLKYFNASPDEYIAIFTNNATGALKLVGEAYPFTIGSKYLLTFVYRFLQFVQSFADR